MPLLASRHCCLKCVPEVNIYCFPRYVSSWIDMREVQSEKANLQILFDKYVPICLDTLRVRFKKITPVPDITMVTTLCYLLECLLNPTNTPPDCNKELYELYFVFAAVWAFGGAMFQDQVRVYENLLKRLLVAQEVTQLTCV